MQFFLGKGKEKELIVGLHLYRPNYLQDKFEDNLCRKIVEMKGDDLDLQVIRGNIRTLRHYGLRSVENLNKANQFNLKKRITFPMKKIHYSNSYLNLIGNLMWQSKHVENYYDQRRNISIQNPAQRTISSPMISASHFYQSQSDFYKTRNLALSPPASMKASLTKKSGEATSKRRNREGEEELKLLQPENEEFSRFDDRLSYIPERVMDRLKAENNFFKEKDSFANDSFNRKRESLFRVKDPLDKSKYLRREYFNKRSPYVRTAHLIELRHSKRPETLKRQCKKMLIAKRNTAKNMLEFGIND